jgi:hypothetical protein
MTDPKTQEHRDNDNQGLELEAEAIRDLDVDQEDADAVRGGPCPNSFGIETRST